MSLHLDSEYRRRWEEYKLEDGTVLDSRKINWREVEWEKVVTITAHVEKQIYRIKKEDCENFKGFMRFRWGGKEAMFNEKGKYTGHKPINIWTIGYTDGNKCFLKDIDFYRGDLIQEYEADLLEYKKHIHPRLPLFEEINKEFKDKL